MKYHSSLVNSISLPLHNSIKWCGLVVPARGTMSAGCFNIHARTIAVLVTWYFSAYSCNNAFSSGLLGIIIEELYRKKKNKKLELTSNE